MIYNGTNVGFRMGALCAGLVAVLIGAYALAFYGATHPKPDVTKKEVTAAIAGVAGDQNLYAMCEASVTQTVNDNYGQVQSLKHVSMKEVKDVTKVTVGLRSTIYNGNLTCDFKKSNWRLTNVAPS